MIRHQSYLCESDPKLSAGLRLGLAEKLNKTVNVFSPKPLRMNSALLTWYLCPGVPAAEGGVPQPVPQAAHPAAPGPLPHAEEPGPGVQAGAAQAGVGPQVSGDPGPDNRGLVTRHQVLTPDTGADKEQEQRHRDPHGVVFNVCVYVWDMARVSLVGLWPLLRCGVRDRGPGVESRGPGTGRVTIKWSADREYTHSVVTLTTDPTPGSPDIRKIAAYGDEALLIAPFWFQCWGLW